jgi:SAM-dependent methyltransferase
LEEDPSVCGGETCPLCGGLESTAEAGPRGRLFRRCAGCRLTFLPAAQHPTPEEELARYRLHRNDPADPGYRAHLGRLVEALAPRLRPGQKGLDYGSGPGPALAAILRERGLQMSLYDPHFAPDAAPLARDYDFITCTETAEHFRHPGREFARLARLLRKGGWLGMMTRLRPATLPLADWWYAQDVTHLCFYERDTMEWIAVRHGWQAHFPLPPEDPRQDVILFHHPG